MTDPERLSHELRNTESDDMTRRRWVVGLSLFGAAIGGIVGAYQMGILRRLPDPPAALFDSERVDASGYAYKRMQTPDGLLMAASYAMTAALAGAGSPTRARERPLLPIAMAGKSLYDAANTVKLAREEWEENRAFCAYCQAATATTLVMAALALPEALRALSSLTGRRE